MHVAAANPRALNGDDLDADLVARERAIAEEKASQSGKPAEIVTKMVDGAIAKFRKENALLSQLFVIDGKTRSEEHTSELQSLMRISYAVFCLKKKKIKIYETHMTLIKEAH